MGFARQSTTIVALFAHEVYAVVGVDICTVVMGTICMRRWRYHRTNERMMRVDGDFLAFQNRRLEKQFKRERSGRRLRSFQGSNLAISYSKRHKK